MSTPSPDHPGRADARTAIRRALERGKIGDAHGVSGQTHHAVAAVLGCVTGVLSTAAEREDADLAQVCRGVLDALGVAPHPRYERPVDDRPTGPGATAERCSDACAQGGGFLPPPGWASRSVLEDGGVVHETVSPLRPTIVHVDLHSRDLVPTDVSISVTDRHVDGRWIRTRPIIQIEGGGYSLDGARLLQAVLDGFLASLDRAGVADQADWV